jgi:hypothetical protein
VFRCRRWGLDGRGGGLSHIFGKGWGLCVCGDGDGDSVVRVSWGVVGETSDCGGLELFHCSWYCTVRRYGSFEKFRPSRNFVHSRGAWEEQRQAGAVSFEKKLRGSLTLKFLKFFFLRRCGCVLLCSSILSVDI